MHLLPMAIFGAAAAFVAAVALPGNALAEPLRLRADYWCPYNCNPGDKYPGYMIEIAKRTAEKLGMEVDYRLMPWDRAMAEVRAGSIDAAVGATSLESEGLILSEPLGYDADCFFARLDSPWQYEGVESLRKILLGAVSGYTHDEGPIDAYIAANNIPSGRVTTTTGDDASLRNIRLLLVGRVDVILDSAAVVMMEASRQRLSGRLRNAGCLEALPIYIAFSPKQAKANELVAALHDEIDALRKSGRLAEILRHYGLNDWKK